MNTSLYLLIMSFLVFYCGINQNSPKIEKIIFNTDDYGCWGLCPAYHFEVNSDLNTKLYVEKYLYYDSICYKTNFAECELKTDSSKIGYFKGKINTEEYKKLKYFIEKNRMDTIVNNRGETNCNDGLYKKYILYFNGNSRKEITYNCSGNIQLDSLTELMYNFIENSRLKRTGESFFIENINIRNHEY